MTISFVLEFPLSLPWMPLFLLDPDVIKYFSSYSPLFYPSYSPRIRNSLFRICLFPQIFLKDLNLYLYLSVRTHTYWSFFILTFCYGRWFSVCRICVYLLRSIWVLIPLSRYLCFFIASMHPFPSRLLWLLKPHGSSPLHRI